MLALLPAPYVWSHLAVCLVPAIPAASQKFSAATCLLRSRQSICRDVHACKTRAAQQCAHCTPQVTAEAAAQTLKNLVFSIWQESGCEGFADTVKSVGLVNFYLPFFPLERQHISQLFRIRIQRRVDEAAREGLPAVSWGDDIVPWLTNKVSSTGLLCRLHLPISSCMPPAGSRVAFHGCADRSCVLAIAKHVVLGRGAHHQ